MKRVIFFKLILILIFISFFMITCSKKEKEQERRVSVVKQEKDNVFAKENRLALIIGNSDYKVGPLRNPVNDARAIAEKLENLNFHAMLEENKSQQEMKRAILKFGKALKKSGGVGLFYFGGHGMQVKGKNYLIPVESKFESEEDVEILAVDVGMVLNRMENARNRVNIIILDACRDNPFIKSSRSGSRGLAAIDAPGGTIIAYSTAPGSVAEDGAGDNSTYTKYLLSNIGLPGLKIEDVFKNVRKKVMEDTQKRQTPWESSSLVGDFYFKAGKIEPPPPPSDPKIELAFWKSIEKSANPEDFEDYLQRFPEGVFSGIAQRRLEALEAEIDPSSKEQEENAWMNWQIKFQNEVSELKKIDTDKNVSSSSKKSAWEKLLSNYSQDNPFSNEDEQLRTYAKERFNYWKNEIKRLSTITVTQLRSSYKNLSLNEVEFMLKQKGFFDSTKNKSGSFDNNYQSRTINGDEVVVDGATGLMWHQSGSTDWMGYEKAEQWIRNLNNRGYSGYNDWRLPTLEEGASLLENSKQESNLYIDPVFSGTQKWIWTGDKIGSSTAWVVYFRTCFVGSDSFYNHPYHYVRPVRSIEGKVNQQVTKLSIQPSTITFTRLRSSYMTLSEDDMKSMLRRKGLAGEGINRRIYFFNFINNFQSRTKNGDNVVIDRATGLMWHQSGSSKNITYDKAEQWIRDLNKRGYAGYNDWRLPTVEEGGSLIENRRQKGELYISPVFSYVQEDMWAGDKKGSDTAWVLGFRNDSVYCYSLDSFHYVRPVCSIQ